MQTHGSSVGCRVRSVAKLTLEWYAGGVLIPAAALKTPTINGYNAQGVNLNLASEFPSHFSVSPNISLLPHACTGITLGLLLVARVVVGSQQATEAAGQVLAYTRYAFTCFYLYKNQSSL